MDEAATTSSLFARLCELFAQDPLIDEIGLVLGVDDAQLTPANAFVLEEHKLGVALSAGPQLFREARTRFHQLNPLLPQRTQRDDSAAALVTELLDCTRAVLLISADFYSAWNTRKALVERGWLDAFAETQFCDLVFTLHPKSIDTWAYRRWLATQLLSSTAPPSPASSFSPLAVAPLVGDARQEFCDRQVAVCSLLAEQKPRNYHAWSFRHWVASHLPVDALERELGAMALWCERHITDHSGWNHRQHVLNVLIQRTRQQMGTADAVAYRRTLIVAEHAFLSTIMATYPSHEALWCHRRFVVQLLVHDVVENVDSVDATVDYVENTNLSRVLTDLTVKAASATAPTKIEALAPAHATQTWQAIEALLLSAASVASPTKSSEQVLLAVALEVETAWRIGHRYAQRFALWCVERVLRQAQLPGSTQWRSLETALCISLRTADPLLDDLWRSHSAHQT